MFARTENLKAHISLVCIMMAKAIEVVDPYENQYGVTLFGAKWMLCILQI